MSLRKVFFPNEQQSFGDFCNSSNGIFVALGGSGIFYSFICQLLRTMCVVINLTPRLTPFVPRGTQGGPGQHPGVQYSADIFIYLPNNVEMVDNQPFRNPNLLPLNHIHIYPCAEQDNSNRTGCKDGGLRKSFSSSLQQVPVGWKRKNGDLQCGNGALCGIFILFPDINGIQSHAYGFYDELTNPGTHFDYKLKQNDIDRANGFKRTSSPSVSRKQKSKSRKKSPKKGGRKSPKKGGRKSPKKGGRKSPKKSRRKSPKKGGRKSRKKGGRKSN